MAESLTQKTLKGLKWSVIERFSNQLVSFGIGIVLARLLSPSDYGLIAMTTIFIVLSDAFVDSGFSSALIRKLDRNDVDNSTAFYFNIVVGVVAFLVVYAVAPLAAAFYKEPQLTLLVRMVGVNVIFHSLGVVQQSVLTAKIDFRSQAKITLSGSIVSGAVGITMAYMGYGVWALAAQSVLGSMWRTVLLWIVVGWRPLWCFSRDSFRYLFGYGSKLLASGLLDAVWKNVYTIVIGKVYSTVDLGNYTRASQTAQLPSSNITGILQRVTFPVLSKIQDDDERLQVNYRRILRLSAMVVFPLMMLLAALSDPLIRFLLTDKWAPCIILLQIICFSMMWYPIHAINLSLLQVKGRSDLFLKLEIVKKVISALVICVSVPFGVMWMCVGGVFTSVLCLVVNTHYTGKLIHVGFLRQMGDLVPVFVLSVLSGAVAWCAMLPFDVLLVRLIVGGLAGFVAIILLAKVFAPEDFSDIKSIVLRKNK